MGILVQIEQDFSKAFKEKNELMTLTLRQLKSILINASIAKNRQDLSEEDVIKVLRSEVKKRKDASNLYQQGGRNDLAQKENQEIEIISRYLPPEMDKEQVKQKVLEVIKKIDAKDFVDMGKVIGLVMKELGNKADGSVVSQLTKEALSQNKPE